MKTVILFRKSFAEEQEFEIAKKYFNVVEHRNECNDNLVICRYSCLPYYSELEYDLKVNNDCVMINSYKQHCWIANFEYYDLLKDYTFETWDQHTFPYCNYEGNFCVKGKTNSKKHQWKEKMFAPTKEDAIRIGAELSLDGLIGQQDIIYRKYVPLKTFEYGINGLPFSNEWRFFFLKNKLLSYGYYWTCAEKAETYKISQEGLDFAQKISNLINSENYATFYVLDIAEKAEGGWILVEVNDGQCSGLSMNNASVLYGKIKEEIR